MAESNLSKTRRISAPLSTPKPHKQQVTERSSVTVRGAALAFGSVAGAALGFLVVRLLRRLLVRSLRSLMGFVMGWVLGFAGTSGALRRNCSVFWGSDGGWWRFGGFPRGFVGGWRWFGGLSKGLDGFCGVGLEGFAVDCGAFQGSWGRVVGLGSVFGAKAGGDSSPA